MGTSENSNSMNNKHDFIGLCACLVSKMEFPEAPKKNSEIRKFGNISENFY